MLSGGSLALLQGVLESIPVAGTRLTLWVFGGSVPGHQMRSRSLGRSPRSIPSG